MSIINITSGINKIEGTRSLSEWAVEFISQEKITRENHSDSESFRKLLRRQKDAVRYQLRKNRSSTYPVAKTKQIAPHSKKPTKVIPGLKSKFKIALSIWISCFLLVEIVEIYAAKGLSLGFSWQAAILVELCIVASSLSREQRIRKIAYLLMTYNAALFALSEANQLIKLDRQNTYSLQKTSESRQKINEINGSLKNLNNFRDKSFLEMSKLVKKGYVSSISSAVIKINSGILVKEQNAQVELQNLEEDISKHESRTNSIYLKVVISLLYFFLRCILQLFSIWILKFQK